MWLIGAMVCLLAAPWVQLSVSVANGWPHNALRHHWLMPISCHFRDCKALLVTSLTHVSGATTSVQTFSFGLNLPAWAFITQIMVLYICAYARPDWQEHNVFYLSVCSSVRPSVTKLVNTMSWEQTNHFWCKVAQVVHEARAWNGPLLGPGG